MPKTIGAFDFEWGNGGVSVVPRRSFLMAGCLSEDEIEAHVRALKDDLDAVAQRMKAAVREEAKKPLFPDVAPDGTNAPRS